ncbi:hypothetical protein TraAM80_08993 [Trypanosoma rangeli]|uniref:DUF4139 domain-containing protein n=1 Tax=Trypanosoma rangeli TaxID=5698 RepID=A0A3R7LIT5_TRYRA|nr:uncharacterized protein TraAM80_08993 [Trypanosoma rangeli]RNE98060.1 hypothetical protein TraAM80_08993 [Trypanosoma rangeli]|eukprot:RNE98060.1 hypothetical protein TraAM80_08993 [Trypanosoma rangeli]
MPQKAAATEELAAGSAIVVRAHSRADAVTVYQSEMQVRRVAEVALPATTSTAAAAERCGDEEREDDVLQLLFAMPPQFQQDSVQVRFDEHTAARVVLRGVLFESTPAVDCDAPVTQQEEELEKVRKQIRELQRYLKLNLLEQKAVKEEADLHASLFKRACSPVTDGLQAALEVDFWEAQLAELETSIEIALAERRRLQKEADGVESEVKRLQEVLDEMKYTSTPTDTSAASNPQATSVCIVLKVKEALPHAVVYVSYMSSGASWRAEYEVGLDSHRQLVTLRYNAVVHAGVEDLQDVALTLSSAVPCRNSAEPKLEPWQLQPGLTIGNPNFLVMCAAHGSCESSAGGEMGIEAAMANEMTGMMTFTVPSRHTLRRGGAALRVPLTVLEWKATVSFMTVPAVSENVFAKAVCTNESDYLLLPGNATVTLNGDFVANDSLEQTAPGEQLSVHFGVDKTIEVRRRLQQQLTTSMKPQLFGRGSRQRRLFSYTTTLKNKKRDEAVTVTLRQHVPKSDEEALTVRLLEPKNYAATANEEQRRRLEVDGVLEVQLTLKSNETVELPFSFEVEAPIGAHIYGL